MADPQNRVWVIQRDGLSSYTFAIKDSSGWSVEYLPIVYRGSTNIDSYGNPVVFGYQSAGVVTLGTRSLAGWSFEQSSLPHPSISNIVLDRNNQFGFASQPQTGPNQYSQMYWWTKGPNGWQSEVASGSTTYCSPGEVLLRAYSIQNFGEVARISAKLSDPEDECFTPTSQAFYNSGNGWNFLGDVGEPNFFAIDSQGNITSEQPGPGYDGSLGSPYKFSLHAVLVDASNRSVVVGTLAPLDYYGEALLEPYEIFLIYAIKRGEEWIATPIDSILATNSDPEANTFGFLDASLGSVNNVWVAYLKVNPGVTGMYVARWNPQTIHHYVVASSTEPLLIRSSIGSITNSSNVFRICSDSSTVSLFTFRNTTGIPNSDLLLRIRENPLGTSGDLYGSLDSIVEFAPDSIGFYYQHPWTPPNGEDEHRAATLQIYDEGRDEVVAEEGLHIFRAPVVLVHGWTGSPKSMAGLEIGLKETGWYPSPLLSNMSYYMISTRSFYENRGVVPSFISATLRNCWNAGFAASKVDVVGHSYGGVLTRFYLQSAWGMGSENKPYRGDINRLITIDSPHMGSQAANFAKEAIAAFTNHSCSATMQDAALLLFAGEAHLVRTGGPSGWFTGQACNDLRVDSDAMQLLNGESLNNAIVPSRTVYCIGPLYDYINKFEGMDGWAPVAHVIIAEAKSRGLFDAQAYLNEVYNGDQSDVIVPRESQRCGMHPAGGPFRDTHGHAPSSSDVIQDIRIALSQSPSSPTNAYWVIDGFHPTQLIYNSQCVVDVSPDLQPAAVHIELPPGVGGGGWGGKIITSPAGVLNAIPGQQIQVSLDGPPEASSLLVIAGSPGIGGAMAELPSSRATYTLRIPTDAVGRTGLLVAASGPAGILAIDSLDVTVTPTASLTGLSLQPATELQVYVNDQSCATLFGSYADGVTRDLTSVAGVSWWSGDGSIATVDSRGVVTGILSGDTDIYATYQGDTANAVAHVVENAGISSAPPGDDVSRPQSMMLTVFPNPGSGHFAVELSMPRTDNATVDVFDVVGRLVRRLLDGYLPAGRQELLWDAHDERGVAVPSGIYYVRIRAGTETGTRSFVLLR